MYLRHTVARQESAHIGRDGWTPASGTVILRIAPSVPPRDLLPSTPSNRVDVQVVEYQMHDFGIGYFIDQPFHPVRGSSRLPRASARQRAHAPGGAHRVASPSAR